MLNLESFPVGPLGCNCFLLWDPAPGLGVVVDPGGEGAKIRRRVEALGFKVTALLRPHAHFDHVGATGELRDLWQRPAHLHADDTFRACASRTQAYVKRCETNSRTGRNHAFRLLVPGAPEPEVAAAVRRGVVVAAGGTLGLLVGAEEAAAEHPAGTVRYS
jgi:glyoxylase-like metal-dependent hydrolase (beta-lactamase superfamily II)